MSGGWYQIDADAHCGPPSKSRKNRETLQQEKCVEQSMKNNAEELVIKEHL